MVQRVYLGEEHAVTAREVTSWRPPDPIAAALERARERVNSVIVNDLRVVEANLQTLLEVPSRIEAQLQADLTRLQDSINLLARVGVLPPTPPPLFPKAGEWP
ncbi:hypothetical protein LCGC14_1938590, partial [marine sediment metagenome]